MVGEPLVSHHPARAIGGEPKLRDFGLGRAERSADERYPVLARLGRRAQMFVESLERVVPACRLERPTLGAPLRPGEPVGIVNFLQSGLAASAYRTLAYRIGGITLQLDD